MNPPPTKRAGAPGRRLGHVLPAAVALIAAALHSAPASAVQTGGGPPAGPVAGPAVEGPPAVGVLQVAGPARGPFLLHGTLPVPPGVFPRGDGKSPFHVRTPTGAVVPTQTEAVSHYPDLADGADVVEVLARVPAAGHVQAGQPQSYEVLLAPSDAPAPPRRPSAAHLVTGPEEVPPSVANLLLTPGRLFLYAEDVFGNPYLMDLTKGQGPPELTRFGRFSAGLRTYGSLLPVLPTQGPAGTLPHLFGVHAYLRTYSGDAVLGVELRIHNGHDGHDAADPLDDALGDVYFRRLDLVVADSWIVQPAFWDLQFGPTLATGGYLFWSLARPQPSGAMHVIPWRGQLVRRFAVSLPIHKERARDLLDQRGLAFARPDAVQPGSPEPWSWWNPATARYYPQRQLLPRLTHLDPAVLQAELAGGFTQVEAVLVSGGNTHDSYPVPSNALGWAHPCLLYTSPSPRDQRGSRMPSSA